jgi:hypothetical protein
VNWNRPSAAVVVVATVAPALSSRLTVTPAMPASVPSLTPSLAVPVGRPLSSQMPSVIVNVEAGFRKPKSASTRTAPDGRFA